MGQNILTDKVALKGLTAPIPAHITSLNDVSITYESSSEKFRSGWHGRAMMQYTIVEKYMKYLIGREAYRISSTIDLVDVTLDEREDVDQTSAAAIETEGN